MKLSILVVLAGALVLASCHRDTRPGWQKAEPVSHLTIPAGIDSPGRSAEMVVPESAGTIEGSVRDSAVPPVTVSLASDSDVEATWQKVVNRLEADDLGQVVRKDDADRQLSMTVKGSMLPGPQGGYFSRMLSSKPDPKRDYYAHLSVISENGQTLVNIDGDGRSVMYVANGLEDQSIRQLGTDSDEVSSGRSYGPRVRDRVKDASGRSGR